MFATYTEGRISNVELHSQKGHCEYHYKSYGILTFSVVFLYFRCPPLSPSPSIRAVEPSRTTQDEWVGGLNGCLLIHAEPVEA